MNNKVIIGSVIGVILLFGAIYIFKDYVTVSPSTPTLLNEDVQSVGDVKAYRNEQFGYELSYSSPLLLQSLGDNDREIRIGPPSKTTEKFPTPDLRNSMSIFAATSSFLSLDEMRKKLEGDGFVLTASTINNIPVLMTVDVLEKRYFFLVNEFAYDVIQTIPYQEGVYAPVVLEDVMGKMSFFTSHSPAEVLALIRAQKVAKIYRNENFGFELEYEGDQEMVTDVSERYMEIRLYPTIGYMGSNIHIKIGALPVSDGRGEVTSENWYHIMTDSKTIEKNWGGLKVLVRESVGYGSASAEFMKGDVEFEFYDTFPKKDELSRIQNLLQHMKFFPPSTQ